MQRAKKRFLTLISFLPVVLLVATWLYMLGMARLEGDPRGFWRSLEFVAETITTTGYGSDVVWSHPAMVILVVVLQFFGVVLMYMFIPLYLIQFLEERFESRLPRQAPKIRDHVVIYRYGPAVETLTEELTESGVPLLIVEYDQEVARGLRDRKILVVYEEESSSPDLDEVNLLQARAMIVNGSDEENAAAILVARQLGFEGEILALVEEPYHRRPITLAGADAVFTPRHVLGAALAARASQRISPRISGIRELGRRLEVGEIRIDPGSPLAGRTLGEAEIGTKTGAIVIGQWVRGHLEPQPTAAGCLQPRGILVAVGSTENLERLRELAGSDRTVKPQGPFLLAGYGEVGRKVGQLLRDAGEEIRVIDLQASEGVDVVGDILDPRVLESLDPASSRGIILALDSDRATLFATVIVKELAPEVPIIARVNAAENVERTHHAGADFALSISQVSGKILAARLLRQEAIELDTTLRLLKVDAPGLAERHPAALDIRGRTGCSVVAVERGADLILDFGTDFAFGAEDTIYICGTREATRRFSEVYA
ncbi:MAG: NAD-binding protein [Thermoanaerobaculia bacterium]